MISAILSSGQRTACLLKASPKGEGFQPSPSETLILRETGAGSPNAKAVEPVVTVAYWVVFLVLAFRVKSILEDSYDQELSVLWTFLFGIVYLQYTINRVGEPQEQRELGGSPAGPPLLEGTTQRPDFDLSDPDAVAFCPSCGAGYTAGATECVDCQVELWSPARVKEELQHRTENELDVSGDAAATVDNTTPVLLCSIYDPLEAGEVERELSEARIWVIVYRSGLTKGTGVLSGARRIDVTMSITRIPL